MHTPPNLTYIKSLADGDSNFENELIALIKEEFTLEVKQYYLLLEKKDFTALAACVHKLKHKIGVLGLTEGYHLARAYERAITAKKTTHKEEFDRILKSLSQFTSSL